MCTAANMSLGGLGRFLEFFLSIASERAPLDALLENVMGTLPYDSKMDKTSGRTSITSCLTSSAAYYFSRSMRRSSLGK